MVEQSGKGVGDKGGAGNDNLLSLLVTWALCPGQ